MPASGFFLAVLLLFGVSGCGFTNGPQVRVQSVRAAGAGPVELVVSVDDPHEAVAYLESSSFAVQENDVELDSAVNPIFVGDPRDMTSEVVVLVDLGGPATRAALAGGLTHLVEKLVPHGRVILLGFRGNEHLEALAEFEPSTSGNPPSVQLPAAAANDNSRNLNGAVMLGLKRLQDGRRIHTNYSGTLVVITQGVDTSARISSEQLWKDKSFDTTSVFGARPEGMKIDALASAAHVIEFSNEELTMRLFDLAIAVRNHLASTYLLRYCSSARSGRRSLAVRVHYEGNDGQARGGFGRAPETIDASHFAGTCKADVRLTEPEPLEQTEPEPLEQDETEETGKAAAPKPESAPSPAAEPPPKAPEPKRPPRTSAPRQAPAPPAKDRSPPEVIAPPSGDNYR